jgi:hypothetical protein
MEPTRNHTMCTAVGARRSGLTTKVMPLGKVKVLMGLVACCAPNMGDKHMAAAAKQHAKNCFIE